VIAARKFFLAATALLFRDNATFQLSIALLGMFTAFVYQVVKRPYWSIEERDAYVKDLYKRTRGRSCGCKRIHSQLESPSPK